MMFTLATASITVIQETVSLVAGAVAEQQIQAWSR